MTQHGDKIDKLVSLSLQINKWLFQQSKISVEEKAATIIQTQALSFLQKQQQANMRELANHLNTSFSSATQITERMVQAGFVTRTNDEKDRRLVLLHVTEQGLDQLKQMKEKRKEQMKKLLAKVDEHDVTELIRIQEKIVLSLQQK
jgi:DNA-binding MarR family transcriptional regulator